MPEKYERDILDVIKASGPTTPDADAESEIKELDVDQERERRRILNQGLRQDLTLRQSFAWNIFYLIVAWLSLVFVLLVLQGFSVTIDAHAFKLSDAIVLALIGGTTINILGIFVIVVRNLFPLRGVS